MSDLLETRGRLGYRTLHLGADHPETLAARRDHEFVKLAHRIKRAVDAAPPLTAEQRALLAALLPPPDGGEAA